LIRILLADTSKENRLRFKELLSPLNVVLGNEFTIIKEVDNGTKLLEEIEKGSADLIICDMRLTGVTGLSIVQKLKHEGSAIKVILFGNLEDMENLQLAQNDGALGYLFKPFRRSEMERVLRKSIQQINTEKVKLKVRIELEKEAKEMSGLTNQIKWVDWLNNSSDKSKLPEFCIASELKPSYGVAIYQFEHLKSYKLANDKTTYQNVLFSCIKKIEDKVGEKEIITYLSEDDSIVSIISGIQSRFSFIRDVENSRLDIKQLTGLPITSGIGDVFDEINGILSSLKGAKYALLQRNNFGIDCSLPIWFVENKETEVIYWCENLESELIEIAMTGDEDESLKKILQIREYVEMHKIELKLLPKYFLSFMVRISKIGGEHDLSFENIFVDEFSTRNLNSLRTYDEAFDFFTRGIIAVCNNSHKQIVERKKNMANSIVKHIKNNIFSDITIDTLVIEFSLLSTNLDKISHEVYGLSLKDLISKEKIEATKKLLKDGELTDQEISIKLDLEHSRFQEWFLRSTGYTPYDYRRLTTDES